MGRDAVQAHQPAHTRPADGRVAAVGQRGVFRVDEGFQLVDHPFQIRLAPTVDGVFLPGEVVGAVLFQPGVALVVALGRDDDGLAVGVHVFFQPPTGAVGGRGIKKQVMPIKHIDDRVALAGGLPAVGQVDEGVAIQPEGCDVGGEGFDHRVSPLLHKFSIIVAHLPGFFNKNCAGWLYSARQNVTLLLTKEEGCVKWKISAHF